MDGLYIAGSIALPIVLLVGRWGLHLDGRVKVNEATLGSITESLSRLHDKIDNLTLHLLK